MEERVKCEIIKSQIELLDRFYRVIGDAYNPASITVKFDLNSRIKPESIFIYKSVNNIGESWYYEKHIRPSKKTILTPINRLKELVEWNRTHVTGLDGCEQILREQFRISELKEICQVIIDKIETLTTKWNIESSEYLIDTKDGSLQKFLFLNDNDKSIVFEFGNYFH